MISAEILLDSIHPNGTNRVTTFSIVVPRSIWSEVLTYRKFSRNAGSTRAVPPKKLLRLIKDNPFIPIAWLENQPGMQGGDPLSDEDAAKAETIWLRARDQMIEAVEDLGKLGRSGVHKQSANRLLEAFWYYPAIITATDWDNFFQQRRSHLAQPEIHALADCMYDALMASTPTQLDYGQWHLPYVSGYDLDEILVNFADGTETAKQVSAARCARVSYLTHDGERDWTKDLARFETLLYPSDGAMHASPFEHVCTPARGDSPGNLTGWRQFRHDLEMS